MDVVAAFDPNSLAPMQLLFVDAGITDGVTIPDERSDLGTDRPPQPGRAIQGAGTITWTTGDVGTLYISYFNINTASWVDTSMTHGGTTYVFNVPAAKITNLKIWTDNTATTAQKQANIHTSIPANMWAWLKLDDTHATNCYDSSGNGRTGTLATATRYTGKDVPYSWQQEVGYTDTAGNLIPRDESAPTLDVLGGALQYSGKGKRPAKLVQSGCLDFNGSSGWALISNQVLSGSVFTLSGFVNLDTNTVNAYLACSGNDKVGILVRRSASSNYCVGVVVSSGGTFLVPTGVVLSTGVVYHLALTCDGANLQMYINGAAAGSPVAYSGTISYQSWFTIGVLSTNGTGPSGTTHVDGKIWGVQAFSVAKSGAQIAAIAAGQVDNANAISSWPLVRLGAYDVVGTNHGTVLGGVTAATQDVFHYAATKGFDWCGNLDGTDDYVSVPISAVTYPFSYFARFRSTTGDNDTILAVSSSTAVNEYFAIKFQTDAKLRRRHPVDGSVDTTISGQSGLINGRWHNVAVVFHSATAVDVYFNGAKTSLTGLASIGIGTNINRLLLGNLRVSSPTEFWQGQLSDCILWNSALSDADVTGLQSGTIPSGAVVNLPLVDGVSLTCWNIGSNGNNGTVNGATSDEFWAHRVPAKANGTSLIHGGTPSHPYVVSGFNGGSKIDFTGGVAMAGTSSWETAWAWHSTRSNPLFHREVEITDTDIVEACDRFVAFPAALSGGDLDDVVAYTETIDVFDDTYDETF